MTGAQIILTLQVDYGLGDETILAILADYIDHFCNPEHALEYLLDRADPEPGSNGAPQEEHNPIPEDWPVQPLKPGEEAESKATCGHCGLSWDDGKVTGMTPAPSARCPFETFHNDLTAAQAHDDAIVAGIAREIHASIVINIDDDPETSWGDDGVWVRAWVFVPRDNIPNWEDDDGEEA